MKHERMDSSLYSPTMRLEFVHIPRELLDFLSPRGKYIHLPKKGEKGVIPITYNSVVGRNAEEIPGEYSNEEELIQTTEDYQFTNKDTESLKEAERSAVAAMRFIFGQGDCKDINRAYMINTSTLPVRVKCHRGNERHTVYVKRPDTNRIIGRFFYDIISNTAPIRWGFNKAVFVEESVKGTPLSRIDESVRLASEKYREGLVRAAAHTEFLALYRDVANPRNRIIDPEQQTVLFDFNLMFGPRKPEDTNFLLKRYLEANPIFLDNRLVDIFIEEQYSIARRVEENEKAFFKLARIVGSLVDHTHKTVNERVKQYYGARTLEEYFERKVDDYRQLRK